MGQNINAGFHLPCMLRQIHRRQHLHGKRQVHDLRRMSVAGGQIHQASFRHQVDRAASRHNIAFDILSGLLMGYADLFQIFPADLHIKMPGIGTDGPVLHFQEMLFGDDVDISGNGNENIPRFRRLVHGHNGKTVKNGFHRLNGIHLCHNDMGPQALGSHGNTLSAPSVACNNHGFPRHGEIGAPDNAVPYRLACAVAVVKKILAVCIIYGNHGKTEGSLLFQVTQALDAGGCFL